MIPPLTPDGIYIYKELSVCWAGFGFSLVQSFSAIPLFLTLEWKCFLCPILCWKYVTCFWCYGCSQLRDCLSVRRPWGHWKHLIGLSRILHSEMDIRGERLWLKCNMFSHKLDKGWKGDGSYCLSTSWDIESPWRQISNHFWDGFLYWVKW